MRFTIQLKVAPQEVAPIIKVLQHPVCDIYVEGAHVYTLSANIYINTYIYV